MEGPALRRSYRWRLQLAIWRLPDDPGTSSTATSSTEDRNTQNHAVAEASSPPHADQSTLRTQSGVALLWETNQKRIGSQRQIYDDLFEKHHTDLNEQKDKGHSAEQQSTMNEGQDESSLEDSSTPPSQSTASPPSLSLDPLTAMVMEQEKKEKRLKDLDMKYRKERARRKRGSTTTTGGSSTAGGNDDSGDRFDTYSSHQTLEIIHKDLHRLPPDHHTYHHSRKNLKRYQLDTKNDSTATSSNDDSLFDASVKERTRSLSQLLLIYAMEHPSLGYRQGMHEIASYLLLVLEMDLFDIETEQEGANGTAGADVVSSMERLKLDHSITAIEAVPNAEQQDCTTDQNHALIHPDYLLHDAYTMFECIMDQLSPAYDVKSTTSSAHSSGSASRSPMEQMAQSIVRFIPTIALDRALHQHLVSLHCPPELYCTRWVRLMLSREVLGWRNVLLLWDVLLDCITSENSIHSMPRDRYTPPHVAPKLELGRFTLMQVLEATAASRILLCREQLLNSDDVNESIHVLMNMTPLSNVRPLTAILLSLLRRMQLHESGVNLSTVASPLSVPSADAAVSDTNSSSRLSSLGQQMARDAVSLSSRARDALQQAGKKLYVSSSSGNGDDPVQNSVTPKQGQKQQAEQTNGDPLLGLATHSPVLHEKAILQSEGTVETSERQMPWSREAPNTSNTGTRDAVSISELLDAPETTSELFSMSPKLSFVASDLPCENASSNGAEGGPGELQTGSSERTEMAETLDQCVAAIQDFFQSMHPNSSCSAPGTSGVVPSGVWEALAQIDLVRRQLLEEPTSPSE